MNKVFSEAHQNPQPWRRSRGLEPGVGSGARCNLDVMLG